MLAGLRTVIYQVDDLAAARRWYTAALGIEPYFAEPFYVGFNVGGYELGLDPDGDGVTRGNNAIAYWGVPEIHTAVAHWTQQGAKPVSEVSEVGDGIFVAQLADPFGNVLGLIENPHFRLP